MAKKSVTKTKARTSTPASKGAAAKAVKAGKKAAPVYPQLTARVTGAFKNKAKAFAKTRGLKIGHLITEAMTVYMKSAPTETGAPNA